MSLKDIVRGMRKEPFYRNSSSKQPEGQLGAVQRQKAIIDADVTKGSYERGTSINRIAEELGAFKKYRPTGSLSWQECRHRRQCNGQSFCTKFVTYCAEEKCPKKHVE